MSDNITPSEYGTAGPRRRKRVLVIAYAFSPVLGSEYRQSWELVPYFARDHDVTLLFGDSDGLMGSFAHFDDYVRTHDLPFRAVKVEATLRHVAMARRMLRMPMALFFPVLMRAWHARAFVLAQRLHAEKPFDVVHQLGPIGFRNPGYGWKLGCHTYWGPIGGAQYIDTRMIRNKWSSYHFEALFRNLSVRVQALTPYLAEAARGFDRLSFATVENAEYFAKHYGRTGPVISDQGLYLGSAAEETADVNDEPLNVAWAGSLNPRKNIDALLDVIRAAPQDVVFHIMGDGPRADDVAKLAAQCPNLLFHGRLSRPEVREVLHQSDVILLTSLSEANTAILFEGLECDCIPIAPKINGFVSTLNHEVAFLINQGDYATAITGTVAALAALRVPETRRRMRAALKEHKPSLSWDAIGEAHVAQYV